MLGLGVAHDIGHGFLHNPVGRHLHRRGEWLQRRWGSYLHLQPATSRYVVDWGDGTVTETTSQGGPYPNGDVTHVYGDQADSITIRVQQRWSATWSAGGPPAALDPLQTAAALSFRVVQVQAVRNG